MLHNKQKAISGILIIIVVTIVMLGYSYSFVSAVSSQRSVDHHNALVKKRFSGSNSHDGSSSKDNDNGDGRSGNSDRSASGSHKTLDHRHDSSSIGSSINDKGSSSSGSGLDRKSSSDNSIKEDNNNDQNSDQGTDDRSNTLGTDNNLQSTTRGGQQGTGHNTPSIKTVTPTTPQTACEQGSNCVSHQQESNNHDHSTIATTNTSKKDNTPFVLSLPFP